MPGGGGWVRSRLCAEQAGRNLEVMPGSIRDHHLAGLLCRSVCRCSFGVGLLPDAGRPAMCAPRMTASAGGELEVLIASRTSR